MRWIYTLLLLLAIVVACNAYADSLSISFSANVYQIEEDPDVGQVDGYPQPLGMFRIAYESQLGLCDACSMVVEYTHISSMIVADNTSLNLIGVGVVWRHQW